METLPTYVEGQVPQSAFDALLTRIVAPISTRHPDARVVLESFVESQKAPTYNRPDNSQDPRNPIDKYPSTDTRAGPSQRLADNSNTTGEDENLTYVKQAIVDELFNAITREDNESIRLLIQHNIVTANTLSRTGQTPLLTAILTKNLPTVKQLLELGADPNAFGEVGIDSQPTETRTPLMLAARLGSLPLVKLLFEPPYSANDALVAPDGQIALRLAAEHSHRTIVDYLPSRRGGSYLRFKTHNAHNIARAKKALRGIYLFIKFFVWEIPKFFVWSVPKHGVVLPVVKACKWSWRNRKEFGGWCKRQVTEVPKKVWIGIKKLPKGLVDIGKELREFGARTLDFLKDIAKDFLNFVKEIPKALAKMGKALWTFGTHTLPKWLNNIAIWLWELVTNRISKAIGIALKWTWDVIKSFGLAIWGVIVRIASFFHTMLAAIVTFLRNVTLKDVWNSFRDVLSSIFVTFPKTLWSWMKNFANASYAAMEALFGWVGELLWWIGAGLFHLAIYIPRKLWTILESIGNSMAKGAHEVWVWFNPKA